MNMAKDFLLDADGDLAVSADGDFVIGESSSQDIYSLLTASPGDYKQHILAGVGLDNYLLDDDPADMLREIKRQLDAEGIKVDKVYLNGGKIAFK